MTFKHGQYRRNILRKYECFKLTMPPLRILRTQAKRHGAAVASLTGLGANGLSTNEVALNRHYTA
jgi:hypothetical protein